MEWAVLVKGRGYASVLILVCGSQSDLFICHTHLADVAEGVVDHGEARRVHEVHAVDELYDCNWYVDVSVRRGASPE